MKCLNRIEIQEYIDKEVDSVLGVEIQNHLKNCKKCSSLYDEAIGDKTMLNNVFRKVEELSRPGSIPEFTFPVIDNKKNIPVRFILIIAAASIIGFIFLFHIDRKPITEANIEPEIIMYEYLDGKDMNKLWHDKSQILIIQDSKGNVIQSTITY
jgi:hypothetical protein